MCGVAGVVRADARAPVDRELVVAMLSKIRHRGPDGSGVHSCAGAGLGNNRLAIIDPARGQQPMYSPDGRFVLVYNGEIYNHLDLRVRLSARGYEFRTHSDTETLLYWLIEHGTGGLADINGMFAFVLWDDREKTALCARDRLGIKPLYWALRDRDLIFGSEIKAMLPALGAPEQDNQAIFEFMTFQNLFSERTFFRSVRRMAPGCWMKYRLGECSNGRYWEMEFREAHEVGFDEWARRYSETLETSVRRHLLSDVALGAYLSGGIDSAQVATAAAASIPGRLETFTGAFADAAYYDERPLARETARRVNAVIHDVEVTPDHYRQLLNTVIYLLDEPTLGTGALPQYVVSGLVSRYVKVVLTGHGGDEMFGGYQVNKAVLFREQLRSSPLKALGLLSCIRPDEVTRFLYYLLYPLLSPEVGYGHFIMTPRQKRAGFFTADFLQSNRGHEPLQAFEAILGGRDETPSQRLTRIYLKAYLPTLLVQEDRMSMGQSIEARTPLCDNEMLDLCLAIPLDMKLHGGELKAIPRQAMRGRLPSALFSAPKRGFPTPFALWYRREPLKSFVQDILSDASTKTRGIFQVDAVRRVFDANLASRTDTLYDYARANVIWAACAVELWQRTFIDHRGRGALSA
jgi:asparagine synthase (glutamine-hydrolysing)